MEKQEALGTESINKLMFRYAIPCIISLLVSALYNIVDQLFIANASYLGSYGNAANTAVFPLVVICLAIAGMFGDGTNVFFTYCLGAKEMKEAKISVANAVLCSFTIGILFLIGYNLFQTPLLNLFGANVNAQTFAQAQEYLFYISLGLPFYMVGQTLSPLICGDGSPRYAMITMLIGCAINIILDPIYIYVLKWGMMGAALATITGQIVVAILNASYLTRMKSIKLDKASFHLHFSILKKIISLGLTSFFAQLSIVLSMMAVIHSLTKYGALDPIFAQEEYAQIPLAIVGIVFKFFQIIVSIAIGLSAGCTPIVGYNRGIERNDRLLELLKKILIAEACVGLVATIVFEGFPMQISYLFGAKNESIYYQQFAIQCIRIFLCACILTCLNKGIMIFLQGMGKAVESTFISIMREIVGGVVFPLVFPIFLGFEGILYTMPIAEIFTFIFSFIFILHMVQELRKPNVDMSPLPVDNEVPKQFETYDHVVITIGRKYGSGGKSVGKRLEQRLGIPCYDTRLLVQAAQASGIEKKYLQSMDEKEIQINTLYMYNGMMDKHAANMQKQVLETQHDIIEKIANEESCIIVGRRANQILKGKQKVLSVFITAPFESRVKRVMQRDHLDEAQSRAIVSKVDRERATYYNQLSSDIWGDADTYDLCIDTDSLGIEGTVDVIETAYKQLIQA